MEPKGKGPMKIYTTWCRDGSLLTWSDELRNTFEIMEHW